MRIFDECVAPVTISGTLMITKYLGVQRFFFGQCPHSNTAECGVQS